jgi:hypothetical protein
MRANPKPAKPDWQFDGMTITVRVPMTFVRRGGRKVIVAPDGGGAWVRHRIGSETLGDDPCLLLPAPPPPPLRPGQNLHTAKAVPIDWQITWATIHTRLPIRRHHHPKTATRDNVGPEHRLPITYN